jgi:hypothetical protein
VPFTPQQEAITDRIGQVLFPHASKRRAALKEAGGRFAHYTSAENALSILRSRSLWMRNTTCMADFREVAHGSDMLDKYFGALGRMNEFLGVCDACQQGVCKEAFALYYQWRQSTQLQTYISSFSEHYAQEDEHGRLSMWRGFPGASTTRVALVFRFPLDQRSPLPLNVLMSPVAYLNDVAFAQEFDAVLRNIREHRDFLRDVLTRDWFLSALFNVLVFAAVCLKHEGFGEEREWRAIYFPQRLSSPLMKPSVESVGGVPQIIYRIPLEKIENDGEAMDLSIPTGLDRIIVGPTQFPWATYEAFVEVLRENGVSDPSNRVRLSRIPIRT